MSKSLKGCIEQMCKGCSYDETAQGTWRQQISGCCGKSCELYGVRPLPTTEKHEVVGSRRKAIDAQCKSCMYDPRARGQGTWRKQVENCPVVECPLYPVRPTTTTGPDLIETEEVE